MTPAEIAAEWHLHVESVRRWIRDGRLPATRPGERAFIVRRSDVLDFMERGRNRNPEPPADQPPVDGFARQDPFRPPIPGTRLLVNGEPPP